MRVDERESLRGKYKNAEEREEDESEVSGEY
jgi:hypothetical protein